MNLESVRALVLNSGYEPLKVVGWQKALILFFQGKVEIVEFHKFHVRSARMSFQLPSVLRLKQYVRPRNLGAVRFCRENVLIRDNYTCQYCGKELPPKQLTLDHVVPASQNGKKTWNNMVCACVKCNQRKANRTPTVANMPLLKEPVAPAWLPSSEIAQTGGVVPTSWLQYLQFKTG